MAPSTTTHIFRVGKFGWNGHLVIGCWKIEIVEASAGEVVLRKTEISAHTRSERRRKAKKSLDKRRGRGVT